LIAKAVEPKLGLGTTFAAAMLLDLVLWIFVLTGIEAATTPIDYASHHYLLFNFPYSHSLLAAILWSVAAAVAWAVFHREGDVRQQLFSRAAIVVALTVFSHWLLDVLVHPAQLPITPGGPSLGLDLWDNQPLALVVELALAAFGLLVFWLRRAGSRRWTVTAIVALAAAMTAAGAFSPSPPPSIHLMAYVSLVVIGVVIAVGTWADGSPPAGSEAAAD
jgi:cytochrome bd-type quinol oxidase subunit 2